MVELIKLRQLKAEMQAAGELGEDDEDGYENDEEGECEMDEEEGEGEMDEQGEEEQWVEDDGEDGQVSDVQEDDDEEAPAAVPIAENAVQINHERRVDSDISDIDPDDYDSSDDSSEYDSDELDLDTTANPHGFVYADMLATYQKTRKERIADMRASIDKDEHRNKFKKKQNSKKIGKSEKVHQKNKPFMMVKQKKIKELRDSIKPLNSKKNRTKQFLGHFRKATK